MRFISQFWEISQRFYCPPPFLVGIGLRTTHIIWEKHGAKGWVYSKLAPFYSLYPFHLSIPFISLSLLPFYPFHLSIPFTSLSLSPLYPFHLSIPFTSLSFSPFYLLTSLSLSPLYPFHLSLSLSLSLYLSLLSLPSSLYLSFYLSFFLSPSPSLLSISLFDVFVLVYLKIFVQIR